MILRVGTRSSRLALAQTQLVTDALLEFDPALRIETVTAPPNDPSITDKSRYVSSIEQQLRAQEIDIGVHSAKDVPGQDSPGLLIAAVPPRAELHDLLLGANSLGSLEEGARVGTSSLRRAAQLLSVRPDLSVQPLRGNIDTRLERLAAGEYDAIVLAAAGLARLDIGQQHDQCALDLITAPGQGCLALQVRDIDLATSGIVASLTDRASQRALTAERATSAGLVASCNTPLGVNAAIDQDGPDGKDRMTLRGWLGLPDGSRFIEEVVSGLASEAELLGHLLAQKIRAEDGDELLRLAEVMAA
jgi:hydroxymethylbilane synthase